MRAWQIRLVGITIAIGAAYLAYTRAHQPAALLLCSGSAAALAMISIIMLWGRPKIGSTLAAIALTGGIVAQTIVVPPAPPGVPAPVTTPAPLAAEAARIGNDVQAQLARVSNGIAYEIYPGVFRGPAATLADGAGNDADKTLLLHDLILALNPGAALRFAMCTLSTQQSDRLISIANRAYRAPKTFAQSVDGIDDGTLKPNARALLKRVSAIWADLSAHARSDSARLTSALRGENAPVKAASSDDLRPFVATHIWLQEQIGGTWTDLDPALPQATEGSSLCAASSTMVQLPPTEYDSVTIRVRAEQRQGGAVDDRMLLEGTWRTAQLAEKSLAFMFAEPTHTEVTTAPASVPTGMSAYTPVMLAGDLLVAGQPLVMPDPAGSSKSLSSGAGSAVAGAVAAFGTPQPAPSPTPIFKGSDVTGVSLQITVNAPGAKPEVTESSIFDRIAYADRAAGRTSSAALLPVDQSSGMYLPVAAIWNVALSEGSAVAGGGDRAPIDAKARNARVVVAALGRAQREYYAVRRALFSSASLATVASAQPGISLMGLTWHSIPEKSGSESASLIMDVARDHAAPVDVTASDAVAWGVSSLLAERLAVTGPGTFASKGDRLPARDVLGVFDWAPKENVGVAVVHSARDLSAVAVSDDAKARIASSLADGSVAYVPTGAVKLDDANDYYGWWVIAPDGSVRDEMQDGRHTEGEEETENNVDVAEKGADPIRKDGRIIQCVVFFLAFVGAQSGALGEAGSVLSAQNAVMELRQKLSTIQSTADEEDEECLPE